MPPQRPCFRGPGRAIYKEISETTRNFQNTARLSNLEGNRFTLILPSLQRPPLYHGNGHKRAYQLQNSAYGSPSYVEGRGPSRTLFWIEFFYFFEFLSQGKCCCCFNVKASPVLFNCRKAVLLLYIWKEDFLWYQNTKLCQKPPAPATHRKLLSFPRGLIGLRFARNSFAWDCPGSFSLICWIHSHEGCIHPKQSLFLSNCPHTSLSSAEPRDCFENFALNAHERQLQNSMICTKEENVTTTLR